MTTPAADNVPWSRCPRCDGKGKVHVSYTPDPTSPHGRDRVRVIKTPCEPYRCPRCNGRRKIIAYRGGSHA